MQTDAAFHLYSDVGISEFRVRKFKSPDVGFLIQCQRDPYQPSVKNPKNGSTLPEH